MNNYSQVKATALQLFSMANFISHITNEAEHNQAIELMEELIEEYDIYKPLIEVLSVSIERWEDTAAEFADFNKRIASLDNGVKTLRTKEALNDVDHGRVVSHKNVQAWAKSHAGID